MSYPTNNFNVSENDFYFKVQSYYLRIDIERRDLCQHKIGECLWLNINNSLVNRLICIEKSAKIHPISGLFNIS